jgi:hypothetical protein
MAASIDLTNTGFFLEAGMLAKNGVGNPMSTRRQPRLRRILTTCDSVSSSLFGGVISTCDQIVVKTQRTNQRTGVIVTLVMQTTIGTLRARATARCSFDMPITPALAPITRITQDGAPDVKPYKVVLRYLSWPARSDTS